MATDVQVHCTQKDSLDPDHRIDGIGGTNPSGSGWYLNTDEAIRHIREGTYTFYTVVNGVRANVLVRRHQNGREYLTTSPDGVRPNNLLSLRDCF